MVKNILRAVFIIFIASMLYFSMANSSNTMPRENTKTIIYKNKKYIYKKRTQTIVPKIILGFFTFALVFLVLFVRSKVAKEIRKRKFR